MKKFSIFSYNRAFENLALFATAHGAAISSDFGPLGLPSQVHSAGRNRGAADQARGARDQHSMGVSRMWAVRFNSQSPQLATPAQSISREEFERAINCAIGESVVGGMAEISGRVCQSAPTQPHSESNPEPNRRADRRTDHRVRRVSVKLARSGILNGFGDFTGLAKLAGCGRVQAELKRPRQSRTRCTCSVGNRVQPAPQPLERITPMPKAKPGSSAPSPSPYKRKVEIGHLPMIVRRDAA